MAPTRFSPPALPLVRIAAVALVAFAAGCVTQADYLVDANALAAARAVSASRPAGGSTLPATRTSDGKRVLLRASAIDYETPSVAGPTRVHAQAPAPLATAGAVLTWLGTAVSLAGSITFFLTDDTRHDLHLAAGIVAGAAEPVMITGTALWIVGATRPGQEVRGAGVALTGAHIGVGVDGARLASLRFRF